jgi:hypothetical protein
VLARARTHEENPLRHARRVPRRGALI